MNDASMIDSMIKDGLTDAFHNVHMGNTGTLFIKKKTKINEIFYYKIYLIII